MSLCRLEPIIPLYNLQNLGRKQILDSWLPWCQKPDSDFCYWHIFEVHSSDWLYSGNYISDYLSLVEMEKSEVTVKLHVIT